MNVMTQFYKYLYKIESSVAMSSNFSLQENSRDELHQVSIPLFNAKRKGQVLEMNIFHCCATAGISVVFSLTFLVALLVHRIKNATLTFASFGFIFRKTPWQKPASSHGTGSMRFVPLRSKGSKMGLRRGQDQKRKEPFRKKLEQVLNSYIYINQEQYLPL